MIKFTLSLEVGVENREAKGKEKELGNKKWKKEDELTEKKKKEKKEEKKRKR